MDKLVSKNGNVVVKPIQREEQLMGGIIIPDLGKERPEEGVIVSTSKTYNWHRGEFVDCEFEVGERVLIPKMAAQRVVVNNEEFYIVKSTEILSNIVNED